MLPPLRGSSGMSRFFREMLEAGMGLSLPNLRTQGGQITNASQTQKKEEVYRW
jgi:hypothetical protein